jgi:hypothetical protein
MWKSISERLGYKAVVLTPNFRQKYPLHRIYGNPFTTYKTTQEKSETSSDIEYAVQPDSRPLRVHSDPWRDAFL